MPLDQCDIADAERAVAHLIPKYPEYHMAGLIGGATGLVAVCVYSSVIAMGLPSWIAWILGPSAAYGMARYDSHVTWRPYHRQFWRFLEARSSENS